MSENSVEATSVNGISTAAYYSNDSVSAASSSSSSQTNSFGEESKSVYPNITDINDPANEELITNIHRPDRPVEDEMGKIVYPDEEHMNDLTEKERQEIMTNLHYSEGTLGEGVVGNDIIPLLNDVISDDGLIIDESVKNDTNVKFVLELLEDVRTLMKKAINIAESFSNIELGKVKEIQMNSLEELLAKYTNFCTYLKYKLIPGMCEYAKYSRNEKRIQHLIGEIRGLGLNVKKAGDTYFLSGEDKEGKAVEFMNRIRDISYENRQIKQEMSKYILIKEVYYGVEDYNI